MINFLSWAFWFNSRPEIIGENTKKSLVAIAAILLILVIIIVTKSYGQKLSIYKPSFQKLLPFCYTNAIISLYFIFLNDQVVPVLRSYYWYPVWAIVAIIWIVFIIKDLKKRTKRREELSLQAEKNKYLPK